MTNWKDFLYFSKGERRALLILLSLITVFLIILYVSRDPAPVPVPVVAETQEVAPVDTVATVAPVEPVKPPKAKPSLKEKVETISRQRKGFQSKYPAVEKYKPGTIVELNQADTTMLKKVPGIGSAFANRIVKYRNLLGGFHSVEQLAEVYGMDQERYESLLPWFRTDTSLIQKIAVNEATEEQLRRHPYLDYRQSRILAQLRKQRGKLSGWRDLELLEEFGEEDWQRLVHYLAFE